MDDKNNSEQLIDNLVQIFEDIKLPDGDIKDSIVKLKVIEKKIKKNDED